MRYKLSLLVALAALSALVVGCSKTECGAGTVEVDGSCVPDMSACGPDTVLVDGKCVTDAVECGPLTTLSSDNTCVPDGSAICTGNTVFDAATSTCVIDPTGCGAGTVFSEAAGACVDPDSLLEASVRELPEPNDPTQCLGDCVDPMLEAAPMAQTFELPAEGETVVLGGCSTPMDFNNDEVTDFDIDGFTFTASGPTLLKINADGTGGLAAGVIVLAVDPPVATSGWNRFAVDISNDNVERRIFIPAAGDYVIGVGDSRSLLNRLPSGGAEACYFVQVTPEALPTPTDIAVGDEVTDVIGDPRFYRVTGASSVFAEMDQAAEIPNGNIVPGLVAYTADSFIASATPDPGDGFFTGPSPAQALALGGDSDLFLVVDTVFSLSFDDVQFRLITSNIPTDTLPDDNGTVMLTRNSEGLGVDGLLEFDATAGDVVRITFDGQSNAAQLVVLSAQGFVLGNVCGAACTEASEWVQIEETGTHYLALIGDGFEDGDEYTVAFDQLSVTPTDLTLGTAASADLGNGAALFSADASAADWLEFAVTDLMGATEVTIDMYPRAEAGVLGDSVSNFDSETTAGAFQRIVTGEGQNTLFVVTALDSVGTESFDFNVSNVNYTDLGGLTSAMSPVDRMGEMTPGLYLVRGTEGTSLEITATGTGGADINIAELTTNGTPVETINLTAADGAESMTYTFAAAPGFVAFAVRDVADMAVTYDLNIIVRDPYVYGSMVGALTFTEICPSKGGMGAQHFLELDDMMIESLDDSLSNTPVVFADLPFMFNFYGEEAKGVTVSSNGRAYFDIAYEGSTLSSNNAINAFGDDLIGAEVDAVCTLHDPAMGTFTIEWNGVPYSFDGSATEVAQVQAVLHSDGTMDIILGPDHTIPRDFVTIGVQASSAATATLLADDVPFVAGQSITFTTP